MSNLAALLDLVRTANEVYLINPNQNLRSSFIEVDNLCELTMKFYLQHVIEARQKKCLADLRSAGLVISKSHEKSFETFCEDAEDTAFMMRLEDELKVTSNQTRRLQLETIIQTNQPLTNWTPDKEDRVGHKSFHKVIEEVQNSYAAGVSSSNLLNLLETIEDRHNIRNQLFHHNQTIQFNPQLQDCLVAYIELYELLALLFTPNFQEELDASPILKAQMTVIKLHYQHSYKQIQAAKDYLDTILKTSRKIKLEHTGRAYEFHTIYDDPQNFLRSIKDEFDLKLTEYQNQINNLESINKKSPEQIKKLNYLKRNFQTIENLYKECIS